MNKNNTNTVATAGNVEAATQRGQATIFNLTTKHAVKERKRMIRQAAVDSIRNRYYSGDLLQNELGETARFVNYWPDDPDYVARLHSLEHDDTFSVTDLLSWHRLSPDKKDSNV